MALKTNQNFQIHIIVSTLKYQIDVQDGITVQGGIFLEINKHTGRNKRTGFQINDVLKLL